MKKVNVTALKTHDEVDKLQAVIQSGEADAFTSLPENAILIAAEGDAERGTTYHLIESATDLHRAMQALQTGQFTTLTICDAENTHFTDMDDDLASDDEAIIVAGTTTPELSGWQKFWRTLRFIGTFIGHVVTDGELKAAALPVLIAIAIKDLHDQDDIPDEGKILMTMILWQVNAALGMWVQSNLIAKRAADGVADTDLTREGAVEQDGWAVAGIILDGVFSEFMDGFATGMVTDPTFTSPKSVGLGIGLGAAKALKYMVSDALAAWGKYAQGTNKAPLTDQNGLRWFYQHAEKIALFLRETYGPVIGALHTYSTVNTLLWFMGNDNPDFSEHAMYGAILVLPIWTTGARYANGFDMKQMADRLRAAGTEFNEIPWLVRPERNCVARAIGKLIHGYAIDEAAHLCKGGPAAVANVAAVGNMIGLTSLVRTGLDTYVYSVDPAPEKGILTKYLQGKEKAIRIAETAQWVQLGLGGAAGTAQSYAKGATVAQSASQYGRVMFFGVTNMDERRLLTSSSKSATPEGTDEAEHRRSSSPTGSRN